MTNYRKLTLDAAIPPYRLEYMAKLGWRLQTEERTARGHWQYLFRRPTSADEAKAWEMGEQPSPVL